MSTPAVSSSSLYQQLNQYYQTRETDQQQLGQALASGNLASAQTAFNNIVSLGQNGPFKGGDPYYLSQREQDFTAIGNALQSGDLAGAQQAFAALQSTFKNAPLGPSTQPLGQNNDPAVILNLSSGNGLTPVTPQSTNDPAAGSGPEIILNLGNGGNSSTPEQITITIGNPDRSGDEQVSISAGAQGSNPQQISFNLNTNSNEQIILNLLGATSSTSTAASSASTSSSTTPASGGLSVSA
jgi:hypothetical protein